jgi:hypothetical protein
MTVVNSTMMITFSYSGSSMSATFKKGDELIVVPLPLKQVCPGDVVAFREAKRVVAHRVLACTPTSLLTRGDNNPGADLAPVTSEMLLGKVYYVRRNGKTCRVWGGAAGLWWACALYIYTRLKPILGYPYRWLRKSNLVPIFWNPSLSRVQVMSERGKVVKYRWRGYTIARWWPSQDRFWCSKPFDLVIDRPKSKDEH